jgi:DNA invertase Pin-like site-specific DNA recombinase
VLEELEKAAEAGSVQAVLFAHSDRLGRDGITPVHYYLHKMVYGAKLVVAFADDDPDFRRYPDGCRDSDWQEEVTELAIESLRDGRKIKRRLRRGRIAKVEKGEPPSGRIPLFGYKWTQHAEGKWRRDKGPATNPILRRMGEMFMEGKAHNEVLAYLNEHGVKFSKSGVKRLMRNPAIAGRQVSTWGPVDYDPGVDEEKRIDLHFMTEATFSQEEFEAIQVALDHIRDNYENRNFTSRQ